MSHAERMLRIDCHKIHTVLLLLNARIRNQWLNDELLHVRDFFLRYWHDDNSLVGPPSLTYPPPPTNCFRNDPLVESTRSRPSGPHVRKFCLKAG